MSFQEGNAMTWWLTGRDSLVLQEGFSTEDDFGATDDFTRENDDEEEFQRARRQAEEENARRRAAEGGGAVPEAAGESHAQNGVQGEHCPLLVIVFVQQRNVPM